MCQLSIINLGKKNLNLIADYLISFEPSKRHNDGFGFMHSGNWDKTEHAPIKLINFGTFVEEKIKSNKPIYSHIRDASYGIKINEENAHPFESDNFLLMHNGTLTPAGESKSYKKDRESDSKLFLDKLESEYKKEKDFIKAFNNTMGQFWGKFAFLIYCKKESQYYVCRGTIAHLYKSDLLDESDKPMGYIVNTDKDNVYITGKMISNISQILYKTPLKFSEPELLEANSIFKANNNSLEKIGETKENEEKDFKSDVVETAIQKVRGEAQDWWRNRNNNTVNNNVSYPSDVNGPVFKISEYMIEHLLSPKDVALIFKLYMGGMDILQAERDELNLFYNNILKELRPHGTSLQFLKNNLTKAGIVPVIVYSNYGLEFPWMINPEKEIIRAVKKYMKDQERAVRNAVH